MLAGLTTGRAAELARLDELLAEISQSGTRLVLVEGAAGVGKGSLVDAFVVRAGGSGTVVLDGRTSATRPLAPFARVVSAALAILGPLGPRRVPLGDLACPDGCHALWYQHEGPRRAPRADGLEALGLVERRCFHAAIARLLRTVSAIQPTILVLPPLEATDVETVDLLGSLLDADEGVSPQGPSALMVLAALDVGTAPDHVPRLEALRRHPRAARLAVGPLDEAGLRALLTSPAYLARILARTGGVPAAVERLVATELPTAEEHLARRLAILSADGLSILDALAALGGPADIDALGAVASVEQPSHGIRELSDAGLVRATDQGGRELELVDRGDAARRARALGDGAFTELHGRWCAWLLEHDRPDEALGQALQAGDLDAALRIAAPASRALAARHAHLQAVGLLRALHAALGDAAAPVELEELLAAALEAAGELRAALRPARRVHALNPGDPGAARRVSRLHVLSGELREAARVIGVAREHALGANATSEATSLLASLAELDFQSGRLDLAHERARQVVEGADPSASVASPACLDALQTLAKVALAKGDLEAADAAYGRYERRAREAADVRHEALAIGGRGVVQVTRGELDDAEATLRRCAAAAEGAGHLKAQALAWHNLAVVSHLRHDYASARTRYEEALRLLQLVGNRPSLARVAFNLGELYESLGDSERARAMCAFGAQVGGADVPPRAQAEGLLLGGRIALSGQDLGAARASFEAARNVLAQVDPLRAAAASVGLARVATREGRPEEARALLASLPEGVSAARLAEASLARAELAEALGEDARAAWHEAAARTARAGDEALELRGQLGLGTVLARVGALTELAQALRRATELEGVLSSRVPADLLPRWEARPERRALLALARSDRGSARPALVGGALVGGAEPLRLGFVGASRALRRIARLIEKVGPSDTTVLVRGESGTGKELVARALHATSARRAGPLVTVSCAAIVDTLLLSELFGHEKGAFTGAHERKLGRFELAHGGTLFLDEIGEVSPAVQAALLRVLQERRFERVGGHESIAVDVRVVAATNRDLEAMVRDGRFREDLYYRLHQVTADVPALRERPEDVPALASHFLARVSAERGEPAKRLGVGVLEVLCAHPWPGNVRQLDNVLRAASLFAEGATIGLSDLELDGHAALLRGRSRVGGESAGAAPAPDAHRVAPAGGELDYDRLRAGELTLRDLKKEVERRCIGRALDECGGNISRAAVLLGMKRPRLSQLVKELGLRSEDES